MKYRVVAHGGYFKLESKSGFFQSWWHMRTYDTKDEALHAFTEYLDGARVRKKQKRKIIIAQEKV